MFCSLPLSNRRNWSLRMPVTYWSSRSNTSVGATTYSTVVRNGTMSGVGSWGGCGCMDVCDAGSCAPEGCCAGCWGVDDCCGEDDCCASSKPQRNVTKPSRSILLLPDSRVLGLPT